MRKLRNMQGSRFNTSFQCYVSTDLECHVSRNVSIFWYSSCTQDCSELLYRMWILIRTKTVHLDKIYSIITMDFHLKHLVGTIGQRNSGRLLHG